MLQWKNKLGTHYYLSKLVIFYNQNNSGLIDHSKPWTLDIRKDIISKYHFCGSGKAALELKDFQKIWANTAWQMPVRECFTNPKMTFCCAHVVKPKQELEVLSSPDDFCLIPALPRAAVFGEWLMTGYSSWLNVWYVKYSVIRKDDHNFLKGLLNVYIIGIFH